MQLIDLFVMKDCNLENDLPKFDVSFHKCVYVIRKNYLACKQDIRNDLTEIIVPLLELTKEGVNKMIENCIVRAAIEMKAADIKYHMMSKDLGSIKHYVKIDNQVYAVGESHHVGRIAKKGNKYGFLCFSGAIIKII